MRRTNQKGFSLAELLIVVVVIGVIAALAVPALRKGVRAAENGATFGAMRTIASTQVSFFTSNNRFARLDELNTVLSRSLGRPVPGGFEKNQFVFEMVPASPTDAELREGYIITATRNVTGDTNIYQWELTQSGYIRQVLP
jgi:prepilin-type N-terminal cleavage/methylation domain-containing protein